MSRTGLGLAFLLVLVSSARADAPPSERIAIDTITMNGTGCPPGTAWVAMHPDNTAFDVQFSDYFASVGIGARPTDFRKNCQLNLRVQVPPGFAYAIASVDYRATVTLASGASGRHRANYFFQGQPAPVLVEHTFSGPRKEEEWWVTVIPDESTLVFSSCDGASALNINTELRLSVGTSDPLTTTSFLLMDWFADPGGPTTYHLIWRHCDEPRR